MKVKELIVANDKVVADYEIYYSPFGKESFHTDNIRCYDEPDAMEKEVITYAVMNESEYDSTICANTAPADFAEWYDNKDAKVLVILVNQTESAKDGWYSIGDGIDVYVENDIVVRATKNDGTEPASIYKYDKKQNCWINKNSKVKYSTFRNGYRRGTYKLF